MPRRHEVRGARTYGHVAQQVGIAEAVNNGERHGAARVITIEQHREVIAAPVERLDRLAVDLFVVLLAGLYARTGGR